MLRGWNFQKGFHYSPGPVVNEEELPREPHVVAQYSGGRLAQAVILDLKALPQCSSVARWHPVRNLSQEILTVTATLTIVSMKQLFTTPSMSST